MGLLYGFFGFNDPESKFYGRSYRKIRLKPLTIVKSKEFLLEGFKEKNITLSESDKEIINKAVSLLDGIIGWQIIFAQKCLSAGKFDESFITKTQEEGSLLSRLEFNKFLEIKGEIVAKKYYEIMKDLAIQPHFKFISQHGEHMDDKQYVKQLIEEEYIEIKDQRYFNTDPLLDYSFKNESEENGNESEPLGHSY